MNPYKSITYFDPNSEKILEINDFLNNTFVKALLESVKQQCILILGGDETMMEAIGEHADKNIPFLGLNFGHKGFLLNDVTWTFPEISDFTHRQYPLFDIKKNDEYIGSTFNDIHLYSPEGKTLSLEVQRDSLKLNLCGDGMILATPAGSTGHSKSYGGPILPHESQNLVITPKGNITPQSPKALDDDTTIQIKNIGRKFPIALNIDGKQVAVSQLDEDVQFEIKKSSRSVTLLIASEHLQDWDNKVLQG